MKGCIWKSIKFVGICFGILSAIIIVMAIFELPNRQGQITQASAPLKIVDTPVPPTMTPTWMAPPFASICGSNASITEVQQQALIDKVVGKEVYDWTGTVYNVQREKGWYTVQIDAIGGWPKSYQIVMPELDDSVASLSVDQKVKFSGTIQSIEVMFGLICNPMTISKGKIEPQ